MHITGSTPATRLQPSRTSDSRLGQLGTSIHSPASAARELTVALQGVKQQLTDLAADPERFRQVLRLSFGDRLDTTAVETMRQQTLNGNFGWLPDVRITEAATLNSSLPPAAGTALGAYSKANDTIYLSRELLRGNSGNVEHLLLEEIGHALDAQLSSTDAPGDEGDIFARLASGQSLSTQTLALLRAEDDAGSIAINGQQVEVEFGLLSKLKKFAGKTIGAISDGIRKIGSTVGSTIGNVVEGVQTVGRTVSNVYHTVRRGVLDFAGSVLNSDLVGKVMSVAQWVPVPLVKALAIGYQMARSAYQLVQGIKHGSWGLALGGFAGLATGTAALGASLGASVKQVNGATRLGQSAAAASAFWLTVAEGDVTAALGTLRGAFAGSSAAPLIDTAHRLSRVRDAVRQENWRAVVSIGIDLVGGQRALAVSELAEDLSGRLQLLERMGELTHAGQHEAAAHCFLEHPDYAHLRPVQDSQQPVCAPR